MVVGGRAPPDDRDWTTRRELPPMQGRERVNGGNVQPPPRGIARVDAPPAANGRPHDAVIGAHMFWRIVALDCRVKQGFQLC